MMSLAITKANPDHWTLRQAKKEKRIRIRELPRERSKAHRVINEEIADVLSKCRKGRMCGRPACPVCARVYQNQLYKFARRSVKGVKGHSFVTLVPKSPDYRVGDLDELDLPTLKNRLRRQIERALLGKRKRGAKVYAIGVIEPSYDRKTKKWELHYHIVFFNRTKSQLRKLRKYFSLKTPKGAPERRVSNIKPTKRDLAKCISYLAKFATYERSKTGATLFYRRGKAMRLSRRKHNDLVRHFYAHNFDSFIFKIGFERRGLKHTVKVA